jgi:rubrerythrin
MESTLVESGKGASSAESKKQFKVLSTMESLEKPMKQYLYFAFRRSLRDAESYDAAASNIPEDERHFFFKEMAQRKREEAEKLYSYYRVGGYQVIKDFKKRSIISNPHYQQPAELSRIASIEDTYSFAFKREYNNLDLYSKLSALDSNPNTRILFDYLSQLQLNHIVFIEKKLSQINSLSVAT